MKSLCIAALALLVSLGWSASAADAQSGAYRTRSPLPLPPVARVSSNLVAAGYTSYYDQGTSGTPEKSSGQHAGQEQHPQPAPGGFESAFTTKTRALDDSSADEDAAAAAPADASPWRGCEDALHDTCWDDTCYDDCDACGVDAACGYGHFFGAAGGIVMTRTRAPAFTTTYQNGDPSNALMNTQNASAGWTGGGEVTLGYAFGGANDVGPWGASGVRGAPGVAFTWWGLGEMTGFSNVDESTGVLGTALNASFDVSGVTIDGSAASDFFVGAESQRIWRTDNFNSVEANLVQGTLIDTGRLQMIGLVGFRYFRASEVLTFGSLSFGETWGGNSGADEAFLGFRTINNLYGGQLGAVFNYTVSPRFSLYFMPKAGVYGNQMVVRTLLYSGNGVSTYNLSAYKSDVAFLGQIDTGLTYMVRPNVRIFISYRIVGVSNVALGDNQFLPSLSDTTGFGQVKQNGNLILHGATFGLAWMF